MRWEPNVDGTKYTMTLSCNGLTVEQFELPNDPDLFRDVYLSPFQSKPHRISTVNLGWVNDFFQISENERRDKYDSRFKKFVWVRIEEARKDASAKVCASCCFLLCMLTWCSEHRGM